jgi:hypothetical protein
MESLYVPRTARNAGALDFKAGFKEIRIACSESVSVPEEALSEDSRDLGATKKQSGRQQAKTPDDAKVKQAASWAYRLIVGD